ncbi:sugar transferase [Saxibacter everestensis]|uniref:Sugar transferase n=1 Tax=Saxibacter everestensis TaxID=2909229 RepID=A0ABY8QUY6_9MICO|nr:sugar transferase [Brevibacteriaceae bacterium ZFBP1038]
MAVTTPGVRRRTLDWERSYVARLVVTDFTIICVAVFSSQLLRFGTSAAELRFDDAKGLTNLAIGYTSISILIAAAWMLSLNLFGTRDYKIIGGGSTEYKRITDVTVRLFGTFAIVAFLLKAELGRGYILFAFPCGFLLLLAGRWAWRHWLSRKREDGEYTHQALLIGHREKTRHVAENIQREPGAGLKVVGAITRGGTTEHDLIAGVPVLGDFDDVARLIDDTGVDTLILSGSDDIGPRDLRRLGWDLESRGVDLIVSPGLTDVAGPRIHTRPVAGMPLIHVDYPTFEGRKHVFKRGFDLVASSVLLLVLSPIFLWITIAIRLNSPGSAIFRQERVGLNGRPFKMVKFRSMVTNAEAQLASLLDQSDGNGVLFKLKSDPRVTSVGAFLRRYSLDELPQLFNVLKGQMSLVGPRPPLAAEVDKYDDWAHRRLLVKPGITGLWQVSGRSNLSWEDSVRLDLYYVENWSLMGDIIILYRTAKAVITPNGAY